MIKEMLSSTLYSLEAASKSPPNSWDGCLIRFHSIMPHPFDMFRGAGEVTQFCESETITTPTTKWTLYEYSGPVSPPWEANTWVPSLSSGWRLRKLSLWRGIGSCQATSSFACKQTPHLHLLYTPSCKVAHPFPHFTKEIRASFGNASQNLLLFMQSSEIWILCKRIPFWFKFFV